MEERNTKSCTAPLLSENKMNKQPSQVKLSKKFSTQQQLNKYDLTKGTESMTDGDSDASSQQFESVITIPFYEYELYKQKITRDQNILKEGINALFDKIETNNDKEKEEILKLRNRCNEYFKTIQNDINRLYYFQKRSLIKLNEDNRVLFQQINMNHNYIQLLYQYSGALYADNEKNLAYCNDYKDKIKSLQEKLNELKDEQKENNEIINDIKSIDYLLQNNDKKIKNKKIILPKINNQYAKKQQIKKLILSGAIKGNNMEFFKNHGFNQVIMKNIKNQQIKIRQGITLPKLCKY